MKRREWLAAFPFMALLPACAEPIGQYSSFEVNFSGKLAIVGAGAAGLGAGYLLDRYGVEFEIFEAASVIGGRVRRLEGFADFPIDLGAEWIHEHPRVLAALIDDPAAQGSIDVVPYSPDSVQAYEGGKLRSYNWAGHYYSEYKFRSTTWHEFLERHIAAGILDRVRLDRPITQIDSSGERVTLLDASGETHEADRVLVTVPIKILQGESIRFTPQLSADRRQALDSILIPDGIKAFFEFSERFFPDALFMGSPLGDDTPVYYDAAFRKDSSRNILALFCVGGRASAYTSLASDDAILELMLAELDAAFDGRASASYVDHVIQNWSREPYVQGAYSYTFSGSQEATVAILSAPHDERVFFAGEALSLDNTATVPGAMQSAYAAVEIILRDR